MVDIAASISAIQNPADNWFERMALELAAMAFLPCLKTTQGENPARYADPNGLIFMATPTSRSVGLSVAETFFFG